mgnify:CR=1 FL=1
MVALVLFMGAGNVNAEETVKIGKQNITVKDGRMSPEVLWAMGRIGSAEASADGQQIVYQVGYYSVKANKSQQKICIINADGTGQQTLTTGTKSETDPTWYQGKIAFLSGGQLWTMNPDGTDRKQISKTAKDIEGYKFSPDGSKIILLHSLDFNEIIKKNPDDLPKATGRLVTDLMYRHWDHYVESIQHPFVARLEVRDGRLAMTSDPLVDILDGEPYECPMEPFGGMEQLAWSPDSREIAYTCRKKKGLAYAISTDSDIYLYTIGTGETRNLCKPDNYQAPEVDATHTLADQAVNRQPNAGYDQNPQFSPDGKYIAWLSMERDGYEADLNRLCLYDRGSGEKRYVDWKSDVDAFCWSDSKDALLYFISVWHATENLYSVTYNARRGLFSVQQLTSDRADIGSLQMLNNGRQLLVERHSYVSPADLYVVTPDSKKPERTVVTRVSEENKHILDQLDQPGVEQRWVTTTDGKQMHYWIVLPPNFDATRKYPTLLFCEGGPQSPVSQFWSYRWNFMIMASHGYVIIAPNRHGLPGFGQEWKEQISGDWTGQCMQDYLTAIDDAAQHLPYVDRDRLGAVGASFGGFSVYYLAGHHDKRFKAFIAHDGAFNLESMYTDTEEVFFSNWEYDDAYWNKNRTARAAKTYENSPHRFVDQWDTPILCIHGEKDYRIVYNQGMGAFNAARLRGVPAELLIFPDENHWVLKPQNGILWQRTFFDWLDRWLKK